MDLYKKWFSGMVEKAIFLNSYDSGELRQWACIT